MSAQYTGMSIQGTIDESRSTLQATVARDYSSTSAFFSSYGPLAIVPAVYIALTAVGILIPGLDSAYTKTVLTTVSAAIVCLWQLNVAVNDECSEAAGLQLLAYHSAAPAGVFGLTMILANILTFFVPLSGVTPLGIAIKIAAATTTYSWAVTYSKWLIENRVCGGDQDPTWWTLFH